MRCADVPRCNARRRWPGCAGPSPDQAWACGGCSRASWSSRSSPPSPLRAAYWCCQGQQVDLSGKGSGLLGGIGRAVIAQPLHRRRRQFATEALLDGFQHHIADVVATVAVWAGHPTDGLAVAAVQGEGHAQFFTVLAAELEAIRTPAGVTRVHRDTTFVTPRHTWLFAPAFQQQIMASHDAIHPLHVDRWLGLLLMLPTQQAPDPPVAIAGQRADGLLDLLDQGDIVEHPAATRPQPWSGLFESSRQLRARHTETLTDHYHWSSPSNKGECAIHFRERAISTASLRISASMVFLPSIRCSSRICLRASANSEADTTASPALTAERLPSW